MLTPQTSVSYTLRAILVLVFLILVAYSNTFRVSWHFDDYPNILHSDEVRVKNLYPDTLYKAYRVLKNGNHRQRPVSWFTFALNWYWGQDSVVGYHAVNLLIHCVSSIFLFLCCKHILTVYVFQKSDDHGLSLLSAFLGAAMWALHPIQTQAVTYVVQRMASLSGMFYIVAFYCFLKAMQQKAPRAVTYGLYVLVGLCFLLALGSKPSAAMFPVAVGLFYVLFEPPKRQSFRLAALVGACVAVGAAVLYFVGDNPLRILSGYSIRPFTLSERLLTEGRILAFHLAQLFLLKPFRFSLVHDIPISKSFISPPSTLISILFILSLIGLSWRVRKRAPLLSFAIAFFFINHVIESTLLPLELIYEHRNYIPSMFLFLPISYAFVRCVAAGIQGNGSFLWVYLVPGIVICLFIGLTFHRNQDWRSEETLWNDAIQKAPGLARPYHNLAVDYYEKKGNYVKALELYKTAISKRDLRSDHKVNTLDNIASIYFRMGKYNAALEYTEKALVLNNNHESALYNKCLILISMDQLVEAETIVKQLLGMHSQNLDYRALYGFVLMKMSSYIEAEKQLAAVVAANPFHLTALMHLGVLQGITGGYERAEGLLIKLTEYSGSNTTPKICLLDLYRRTDEGVMNRYAAYLLKSHDITHLKNVIDILKNDRLAPHLDYVELEAVLDSM